MKFHITIKDNEKNETVQEFDCNVLVGGACSDGGMCTGICAVSGNGFDMISACSTAQDAIDEVLDLHPMAEWLYENRDKIFSKKRVE